MFARRVILSLVAGISLSVAASDGVMRVTAGGEELRLEVHAQAAVEIVELAPHQSLEHLAHARAILRVSGGRTSLSIQRFDGARDRIYSGFAARLATAPERVTGAVRYAEGLESISRDRAPLPKALSKKGIQVQMVEDALALGIKHAALNVNLAALIDPAPSADSLAWKMDGETFYFKRRAVEAIAVKKLSDAGVQVSLILLNCISHDPAVDKLMRPARAAADPPNQISAFNVDSAEGLRQYKACIEFLAARFSGDSEHGRVSGYIAGNEVNSHWHWYNYGEAPLEALAGAYLRALRITHTAVRKASAQARVYISLDHHWTAAMGGNALRAVPGKALLDELNRASKQGGDFDWHIAYHPYPENLFEARSWNDKVAQSPDAKKITFKNLEQLPLYLRREEQLCNGVPRRVILSEQGFHTPDKPDGETIQAAAFCYAYYKVAQIEGIDAFIYHRHVDHDREGGLQMGLWTNQAGTLATPENKKKIYDVFRLADTAEWEKAFEFALPIIGVKSWAEAK